MRDGNSFFRTYHAALLEYLQGSGESGLANSYDLGRKAIAAEFGLLDVVRIHQRAVNTILDSTPEEVNRESCRNASEEFLMEALSAFEMASRGYLAIVNAPRT